jgi:hypothetical protein
MKNLRLEIILALLGIVLLALVHHWQNPGTRLTSSEIDVYLQRIESLAPLPAEEKRAFIAHMRAWGEADDGEPVYNLNLMRYYRELRALPGVSISAATIPEANAFYEKSVQPMLIKRGVTIPFAGSTQPMIEGPAASRNLIVYEPALDNWDRVLVVRYPNRRAFFDLVADPEYLKIMPYKIASLMVVLTPVKGEIVMPDLRLAFAALWLIALLALGWWRATRRLT